MNSVLFIMAPNYVEGYDKEISGFIVGLLAYFGSFVGSTIALAF